MNMFLTGLGFILVQLAVNSAMSVTQKPRFYGVRTGSFVNIYCLTSEQHKPAWVDWYKSSQHNLDPGRRQRLFGARTADRGVTQNAILFLYRLAVEDTGVYFCRVNNTWGPGTGLQVARPLDRNQAAFRSNMKDGFIILQAILLAVCTAAFLHHNRKLLVKRDIIYEEPEIDHIYEGLAIESCGEALYEELPVCTQVECTEAPWEQS